LEFADNNGLVIELVYYPPYHSKYNSVERCWGILEQHWNGAILNSPEAVRRDFPLDWLASLSDGLAVSSSAGNVSTESQCAMCF